MMTRWQTVFFGVALTAMMAVRPATAGGLLDQVNRTLSGGADPFNKNNDLGVHIEIPRIQASQNVSTITDPDVPERTLRFSDDGWVYEITSGRPPRRIGHAELGYNPQSGRAYWYWLGRKYPAPPDKDNAAFQNFQQKQLAHIHLQQDIQRRNQARQQVLAAENMILSTPYPQAVADVRGLNDQQLRVVRAKLTAVIQLVQTEHLANTDGFQRLRQLINDELQRRAMQAPGQIFNPGLAQPSQDPAASYPPANGGVRYAQNLGIYYRPVSYPNGTFGALVARPPAPGSPAEAIGLERGDVIIELDGQPFTTHEDVLNHTAETEVRVIDVRTKEMRTFQALLP